MEYFQEDVDAMQIELAMWQKAGAAAEADIKDEQRYDLISKYILFSVFIFPVSYMCSISEQRKNCWRIINTNWPK